MRRVLAVLLLLFGLGSFVASHGASTANAKGPQAAVLTIKGGINAVSAGYLARGIDAAAEDGARLIIVNLNTPGGDFGSTRDMVEKVLTSSVPVVVYVSPPGAQAASAGTFVAAAAHIAAMAPSTNIGAASPVGGGGEELPETLKSKATQDAAAFIRSIAEERGRNAAALEKTVLNAVAYSASEALELGIVDLIARDLQELLLQLDGRRVSVQGAEVVLSTQDLELREIKRTVVERFLGLIANPNIAFLLLTLGGIGILIELVHPGLILPGTVGAIALALAFVALGHLPVNWAGVGLIALAMVLLFFEFQAPGIGILGAGGAISFVLGAFLLFGGFSRPPIPTPSFRVSLWLIGSVSGILLAFLLALLASVARARKLHYPSGAEALLGQRGKATTPLNPRGTVQVASELWSAMSGSGELIPEGEEVVVQEIEGLTLKVLKASEVKQ